MKRDIRNGRFLNTFSIACLVAMLMALSGTSTSLSDQLIPTLNKGEEAPSFELDSPDGKPYSFATGKRLSVLVFWSAFCPVCRDMVPDLIDVYREYGDQVLFLSVNVDGERFSNAVKFFIEDKKITYPVVYDKIVDDLFIAADRYGVKNTPTVFFIGKDRKIIEVLEGEEGETFRASFSAILDSGSR